VRKLFYCGLESIESRYTLQLEQWNVAEFKRLKIKHEVVRGQELPSVKGKIVTGSVLDAHGRTYYSMTQMAALVAQMKAGKVTNDDVVLFEDMFTPGIEGLAYIMDQVPPRYKPKVYVRCLAQSIDPDDFVNREGMFRWMRPFEQMVDSFVDGILVAAEEMVANLRIAGFKAPIYVTGLPFGLKEVQSRVKNVPYFSKRPKQVAFAARWDSEKQPAFFAEVIRAASALGPEINFVVLTGSPKLRSNSKTLLNLAESLRRDKKLNFKVHAGLSKNEYYKHLANSRVLFNCALQDWVSNTASEADAFGTQTLYPAYRSFPETFFNDSRHLYIPWSVEDAAQKLVDLVNRKTQDTGNVCAYQDKTIERTIDVLKGSGKARCGRNWPGYRELVSVTKVQ
jgi:glycosyltransferase involved in cell wall biosynthesis